MLFETVCITEEKPVFALYNAVVVRKIGGFGFGQACRGYSGKFLDLGFQYAILVLLEESILQKNGGQGTRGFKDLVQVLEVQLRGNEQAVVFRTIGETGSKRLPRGFFAVS